VEKTGSWLSEEVYEKTKKELEQWPNWKKAYYNELFTSAHSKGLSISRAEK
jgi:hypothetical protein